jgi:hypothetical protein
MSRSSLALSGLLLALGGCAQPSQSSTVASPSSGSAAAAPTAPEAGSPMPPAPAASDAPVRTLEPPGERRREFETKHEPVRTLEPPGERRREFGPRHEPLAQADPPAPDTAPTVTAPGDADAGPGTAPRFRTCTLDSDCLAVDRVGCCHNGWKEAVAATQKEAYEKSFVCPQPHPICPMYIVQDVRVPECDNATHLCTMVRAEDIACMGFIKNKHACPDGYRCQLTKPADVPGKCVKP